MLFALPGVCCQKSQAFRALGRSRASPGPLGWSVALSNNWRKAEGSQLQEGRAEGSLLASGMWRGCCHPPPYHPFFLLPWPGALSALAEPGAGSRCALSLPCPSRPLPPLRSSAYVRSFARCCLSWRIRGFAVRSRTEAGLGWPGAAPLLCLQPLLCPSGAVSPRPGHAPRVPHTICFVRCPCSPSARHGESGGVGHSTNNPCEAAKLGQRCFLSRELDGGAMGGDAGAPGAVGEGGCSRSVTAVQPGRSASSADPSASSLSLDLSWTQFQQREPAWLAEG